MRPYDADAVCRFGGLYARAAGIRGHMGADAEPCGAVYAGRGRRDGACRAAAKARARRAAAELHGDRADDAGASQHARLSDGGLQRFFERLGEGVPRGRLLHAGRKRRRLQPAVPVCDADDRQNAAARSVSD